MSVVDRSAAGALDGAYRIVLAGELDAARADEIRAAVTGYRVSSQPDVVLDVTAVTFMDSTGLGLVARLRRTCTERGGTVTILNPAESVERLLGLVGFDRLVTVRKDTSR